MNILKSIANGIYKSQLKIQLQKELNKPNHNLPLSDGFKIIKVIKNESEKGVYVISNGKESRIAKITPLHEIGNEIEIIEKLGKIELAPKIYKSEVVTTYGTDKAYYEMAMMTGTIEELLTKRLLEKDMNIILNMIMTLLERLCKEGFSHGDFHWRNIGFDYSKDKDSLSVKVLDLEFSEFKCNEQLDIVQLIRTIDKRYSPNIENNNREYIRNKLIHFYNSKFKSKLSKDNVEEEFKRLGK
jgi:tRNA A-37 threonylcarbamoyl transferase component Bud32